MPTRLRQLALAITVALSATAAGNAPAQAIDPIMGTWKLAPERSSNVFGPLPRSQILRFEPDGDNVKFTSEVVLANGSPVNAGWTARLDGREFPAQGNPQVDTWAVTHPDPRTVIQTGRKGGEIVQTQTRRISADGRTMTTTFAAHGFWVHVAATGVPAGETANPFVGTWNLDPAKSRAGGGTLPRSQTMKVEAVGNGIRGTVDFVGTNGIAGRNETAAEYDGRDYPAKGVFFDVSALKRIDPVTAEVTLKKNGEVVASSLRRVSADGKTLSEAWSWYTTFVLEKQ